MADETPSDIIRFNFPVASETGATDFGLRMLIVDTLVPLVKILLQQVNPDGTFVENGRTVSVRHEGDVARAFLAQQSYGDVLRGLPSALVTGTSLPTTAVIVPPTLDVPPSEPEPVIAEPVVPETPTP